MVNCSSRRRLAAPPHDDDKSRPVNPATTQDPDPDSETVARQHIKRIEGLEKENTDFYNKIAEYDSIKIPGLEKEIKNLQAKLDNSTNRQRDLQDESVRFGTALDEGKAQLEKERKDHERTKLYLFTAEEKAKTEEARADRAESSLQDVRTQYVDLERLFDEQRADKQALHRNIDALEDECAHMQAQIEENSDKAQQFQEIERGLEDIFEAMALNFTPQAVVDRFNAMHEMYVLRRDDPDANLDGRAAQRPKLEGGRKISLASIGDELEAVGSDSEFDNEPDSPISLVKPQSPVFRGEDDIGQDGRNGDLPETGHSNGHASPQARPDEATSSPPQTGVVLDKRASGSWSTVSTDSQRQGPNDTRQSGAQDHGTTNDGLLVESRGTRRKTAQTPLEHGTPGEAHGENGKTSRPNSPLMAFRSPTDTTQSKLVKQQSMQLAESEEQIRKLKRELARRPARTKLVTVSRKDDTSEGSPRLPSRATLALALMALVWVIVTLSTWRERNLWLASNDTTSLYGRHLQASGAHCHWAIIEWFEDYIGIDKRLLG